MNTSNMPLSNLINNTFSIPLSENYSDILNVYGVAYTPSSYYWQVREIKNVQGWILHLSIIKNQLLASLRIIVPLLIERNVPFKIVRDSDTAGLLLDGSLGYLNLGKLICIYPSTDEDAVNLSKELITITTSFFGPKIPTDHILGSVIYTRYGAFTPILMSSSDGQFNKYIYNSKNKLVPDLYTIPFSLPHGISWPFKDICPFKIPRPTKLLNYSYYPLKILKKDIKGNVIKANYFKHPWSIKLCLIKQGRQNMLTDEFGRDIRDRLKWQYDLQNQLAKHIAIPKVFNFFTENGDAYLTMEYIKGVSIASWIHNIFKSRNWQDLTCTEKLQVVEITLKIMTAITKLHERGYIHRDITPENFLITKQNEIFLIDIELAWCITSQKPNPPFGLGTPGFMSPEQSKMKQPTIKEDIYALGSLMIALFTNLSPIKFINHSSDILKKNLGYLLGQERIAKIIAECLQKNPIKRPELINLKKIISTYQNELELVRDKKNIVKNHPELPLESITEMIQYSINVLGNEDFLDSNHRWLSQIKRNETEIGNEQLEMDVYDGLQIGLSGPLWILARAKSLGFSIKHCQLAYNNSWDHLQQCFSEDLPEKTLGLYTGTAGIALALVEGLTSGLLIPTSDSLSLLMQCFKKDASLLNLSSGLAGQGIALLQCRKWLNYEWTDTLLKKYTTILLENQKSDGSWNVYEDIGKGKGISTGLESGVSGIIFYLLSYSKQHPDKKVALSITKGLHWLISKAKKRNGVYIWAKSTKSKVIDKWGYAQGIPGIILVFLKAYEILKCPLYQDIANSYLRSVPTHVVRMDFSLAKGLSGLGELYLEAFKATNNKEFLNKADWIANLFSLTFQKKEDNSGYWIIDGSINITADLSIGICGILNFLLFYYDTKSLNPVFFTNSYVNSS